MKITGLQETQRALKREIDKLRTSHYALVGIHEAAGIEPESELTVATLGAILHFGNKHIPERPWLDKGAESGIKEYLDTIREGVAEGLDSKQIMARVGVEAEGAIKQYITDLDTPPNKPSTIRKKGSSNPLIDTGNMRESVTSTVVRKKPKEGLE
ncbi:hypothetical protein [Bordetella bronchiseptica]|uniref:hypothetical protein n=1 Tax=Bordetella bronchiseptica TaxID=518 RepID=UPI0012467155|nr:hypothetical protein [Bordetella bronchiseptica]KAB1444286.1 hypothetical protein F7D00_21330 [Bordetella bronchiseptica]KAB1569392.1 hypothetical protein F7890_21330 [Bordetella bronchiseptica]